MALVVVTAATGSPGATTTCLGLALTWPREVLLADCDREPAQAIQAGFLKGMDHGGRGLGPLAKVHREDRPLAPEIWRHSIELTAGDAPQRRFLPGFALPAAVRLFENVWPELADAFAELDSQGVDVIVDAGRIGRTGLPLPLLARADAICFVTRTSLRALASSRLYLPILLEQLEQLPVNKALGMCLVGPDQPYSSGEISAQFKLSCWAEISWHESHAAVLSEGDPAPKRFSTGSFLNQFRAIGMQLTERISHARELEWRLTPKAAHG